ncbi:MAG: hypothetical protein JKY48_17070 [Flavobacteriales bacterium]|nr:hypothetical protein [Flavobacteriales bacterium]
MAILFASMSGITAQSKSVSSVVKLNINNIQPIKKGDKITGYYVFYKADKVKGGDYSYKLIIYDENVEKVAKKRIIASSSLLLLEAQYNGELLCFKLYDKKEKKSKLIFYNDKAEKIYTKSYEVSKMERKMILMREQQGGSSSAPSLVPIEEKGFLDVTTVKNEKAGYQIKFYPNDKTQKGWKYASKKTSPLLEFATVMEANKNIIVCLVGAKKKMMSQNASYNVVTLDANTGKELYKIKASSPKYEESILNSYYDEGKKELTLFGNYFRKGSNVIKDNSLGIVITTVNAEGKKIGQKYNSWSKDIAKYLGPSKRGKISEIGFIFFHQFVRKADGTFYGIGESYRKTVSGAATAGKILALAAIAAGGTGSNNESSFQITVRDFYIFEFDQDKNITGVKTIEKSVSRVGLPKGAGYYGPQILAQIVKAQGGFDFSYLKTLNEGKTFAVFYQNYEKIKGEKNKSVCGVISHTDGEYLIDKIDLPTEATFTKVLPAQDGNVLFMEYYRKDKKLKMEFKKMNY